MVIWDRLPLAPPVSRPDGGVAPALVTVRGVTLEETLGVAATALALVTGGVAPEGTLSAPLVLIGGGLMPLEGTLIPSVFSALVFSGFVADSDLSSTILRSGLKNEIGN